MPRNSQGLYTLPAGNPVVPGTLIESAWANTTMTDLGSALTGSLPRDGSAPMVGPLTLQSGDPPSQRSATTKEYVDSFLAYASGLPIGFVVSYGGSEVPGGFLLCNGQAVSRTTYDLLFGIIGTTYGSGNGSTTFNVPDLQNQFIRGVGGTRAVGSLQNSSLGSHIHPISDPGHIHAAAQAAHAHTVTTNGHGHTVNDPGHAHTVTLSGSAAGSGQVAGNGWANTSTTSGSSATGITVASVGDLGGVTNTVQPAVGVYLNTTGMTIGEAGGIETVPQNVAMNFFIKAVQDSTGPTGLTGITSSDSDMIQIVTTNPVSPELLIKSNLAFGIPKLGQDGKISINQMPAGVQILLGMFNASGGQNPSQAYPATNYGSGDSYLISVAGTITLINPVTNLPASTAVAVGSQIVYIENSTTSATGWYALVPAVSGVVASAVAFTPTGTVAATNVQAAIAEVSGDVTALAATVPTTASQIANVPFGGITSTTVQLAINELGTSKAPLATTVLKTGDTGQAKLPAGTTAQRTTGAIGDFRYNTDSGTNEVFGNSGWTNVGGAAVSNATPLSNAATGSAGVSASASRNDHVHPTLAATQVGKSATATNNFSLEVTTAGAMKLARGNTGATTQDVMTVDAAGKPTFPQLPVSLAANGSSTLPNGLIVKWGTATVTNDQGDGFSSFTFPTAFPNACFSLNLTHLATGPTFAMFSANAVILDAAYFSFTSYANNNALSAEQRQYHFIAVGY